MKARLIGLVGLMSVASLCNAWGADRIVVDTLFKFNHTPVVISIGDTTELTYTDYTESVTYEVNTNGVRIISPVDISTMFNSAVYLGDDSFLGYFGKFHTRDSGEEEVELMVFNEDGKAVEFLPGVVMPSASSAPTTFNAKWSVEPAPSDTPDDTDPIMHFLQSFMAGDSSVGFEEYSGRIDNDKEDYEAYICRGFVWLTSLGENSKVVSFVKKFGFTVDDNNGTIGFRPISNFDFGEKLQNNVGIDEVFAIAEPVLRNALADFEKVPETWSGGVDFNYGLDVSVTFDYADTLLARAFCNEMLSVLYLMKGYNTVAADGTMKAVDLEALAEAQRLMKVSAEMVNAFVIAQDNRTVSSDKNHFFFLDPETNAKEFLRRNAQNLVTVPYWTVRFDFELLPDLLFLNGHRTGFKAAKRDVLRGHPTLDMTLRNVFEGNLNVFPKLNRGYPLLDASLTDPTFAGMFPGMSRTTLAELLSVLADPEVPKNLPNNPDEKIAHYGVLYNLPEGAVNNPGNPATFPANMLFAIRLLNPTMEGFDFVGWSNGGVIYIETVGTQEFTATFEQPPPGVNRWEIGTEGHEAEVTAWTNGTKLVIAGTGAMKNFSDMSLCPWKEVKTSIREVEIGSGVTSIGESAFEGCSALTSVTIPESVTSIGDWAFLGCSALMSVTIPSSITSIGDYAFERCSALTSVTIPSSITSIGEGVFNNCYALKSVTIPESVMSIGMHAFFWSSALASVSFCGNEPKSVGTDAFFGVADGCVARVKKGTTWTVDENGKWYGLKVVYDDSIDDLLGKYKFVDEGPIPGIAAGETKYYQVKIDLGGGQTTEQTLGVMSVDNRANPAAIGVPFGKIGGHDGPPDQDAVSVEDVLVTSALSAGDNIYVYGNNAYQAWSWNGSAWDAISTVTKAAKTLAGAASGVPLKRGSAFWLWRIDPTKPIILAGRHDTAGTTTTIATGTSTQKVWNLIASPKAASFDLNEVVKGENLANDQILVPTDGAPIVYTYDGEKKWGCIVTEVKEIDVGGSKLKVVETSRSTDTEHTTVPAGRGFWYISAGGAPNFNW